MAYNWINEKTGKPLKKRKAVGNEYVDYTPEEISQIEREREEAINQYNIDKEAKAQKEADAKSGNQKLLDMGLTQAEATAGTGYTPPAE